MKEFCLLVILFMTLPGFAQQDTTETARALRRERAVEAIKALREGGLVVRLPSDDKKIKALEEIISKGGNTKRAQKLLDQTIKENREFNLKLMESFKASYTFSKVYWIHDTAVSRLNAGEVRGFLLNSRLELDPNATIESSKWLTLRFDYTDPATTTRIKAFIFGDQQWETLSPPFPWVFPLYSNRILINELHNAHKEALRRIPKISKAINKEMFRWYQTVLKRE